VGFTISCWENEFQNFWARVALVCVRLPPFLALPQAISLPSPFITIGISLLMLYL